MDDKDNNLLKAEGKETGPGNRMVLGKEQGEVKYKGFPDSKTQTQAMKV
jgi:hypothetical protein